MGGAFVGMKSNGSQLQRKRVLGLRVTMAGWAGGRSGAPLLTHLLRQNIVAMMRRAHLKCFEMVVMDANISMPSQQGGLNLGRVDPEFRSIQQIEEWFLGGGDSLESRNRVRQALPDRWSLVVSSQWSKGKLWTKWHQYAVASWGS